MSRIILPLATAALLGLTACGGGSGGALSGSKSLGLSYVDPSGATANYALLKDASSTPSMLVLNVVAPQDTSATGATPAVGVTFSFDVDTTKAAWSSSPAVTNGNVFTLGSGTLLARGWVAGARLQGIVSNKGLGNQVADIGTTGSVIGQIHLSPISGASAGVVSLTDSGLGTVMDQGGTPIPIQIQVGTLSLN